VAALRERRNWAYFALAAAIFYWLSRADLVAALLLPVTALAVAYLGRRAGRIVGGVLWAGALVFVSTGGSRSPEAVRDPLFWALLAGLAGGISLVTARWRAASRAAAAVAGAGMMAALWLPDIGSGSIPALAERLGIPAVLCLIAVWAQAMSFTSLQGAAATRLGTAARGALGAAAVLALAGAVPQGGLHTVWWVTTLAVPLGLAEADARASARE
jgi:hypothetical protein